MYFYPYSHPQLCLCSIIINVIKIIALVSGLGLDNFHHFNDNKVNRRRTGIVKRIFEISGTHKEDRELGEFDTRKIS